MSLSTRNVLLLLMGLALLVFLIGLLMILRPLLIALTISTILAYLLNPMVTSLTSRLGGKRELTATLVFIFVCVVFGGLFVLVGTVVWEQRPFIQQEFREATIIMQRWLTRPLLLFGFAVHPETVLENLEPSWSNALSTFTVGSDGLLNSLSDNLLWALVVIVSFYYLEGWASYSTIPAKFNTGTLSSRCPSTFY